MRGSGLRLGFNREQRKRNTQAQVEQAVGKLRDLLKAESDRYRSEKIQRQQALQEWMDLLNGLFAQIDTWLRASDPDGLLDIKAEVVTINDPALGEYQAPVRRIELGTRTIEIAPKARYVAAEILLPGTDKPVRAHGLVEIRESGWTRYYLFQLPGGQWYIQTEAQNLRTAGNLVEPLDADRFEAALASILR